MLRPVMPTRTRLNRAISVALGLLASTPASANPEGMQVIQGAVGVGMPNPQTLEITNSPGAIINWQGFDIGAGEITRFIQQGADSAVLNRVTTQNSSEIFGQLLSNGRVFLINPAGILVGRDAVVDTAGLVMSTLDIKDADFTAGRFRFEGGPGSGSITNHGYIKAAPNGEIILIAPRIVNAPEAGNAQSGLIEAENGELILAAGHAITISSLDDPDISFDVQAPEHEVVNLGQLIARGGSVSAFAGTLRHSGEINADALSIDETGRVVLTASHRIATSAESVISARGERAVEESAGTVATEAPESALPNPIGAAGGDIRISAAAPAAEEGATPVAAAVTLAGTIDASGRTGGSVRVEADTTTVGGTLEASGLAGGGRVEVLGDEVVMAGATVRANALEGAGGQVRVGGEYQGGSALRAALTTEVDAASVLEANAGGNGDGGTVVVWSDEETRFNGTASARGGDTGGDGGLVEVSGKDILRFGGSVDVGAPAGDAGTLLLDPKNIFIVQGGATVGIDNPTPFAGDGFGSSFSVLANGNILVQNQNADSAGATDAGEVVLMDGFGNVLGSITGSATNQRLGAFGFFNATGGLLILDRNAPNGAALQAGAVHLFNDDTGQVIGTTLGGSAGELFSSSLIGTFGSNFMFRSTSADIGGIGADVGLVSLISGTTGLEIGRTIGQSAGELFGSLVTNLGTSLLVRSTNADVGALTDAGSVSFVSTTTGTLLGRVDGQSTSEFFGSSFTNLGGSVVVMSASADVGAATDAGAVVLINSTTGAELGRVQGAAAGDLFGQTVDFFGVPSGTYLIRSDTADVGGFSDNGTAVLVSRTTGLEIGRTSGLRDGDSLGAFFPILDGSNYFLQVPEADIGANTDAGSMVLVNGATGARIGSADGTSPNEFFSQNGIELFGPANNIIVVSELADNGPATNAGAVVSIDRTTGLITGRVDGDGSNEQLGSFGLVSRSNGNYFIPSPLYDASGGSVSDAGAVILVDGNTGNELARFEGDTPGERFGEDRLDFSLANDDILVMAPDHNSGAGIIAQLASSGPIVRGTFQGAATGDAIGSIFPTFLSTGNYVIADPDFNGGDGVVVIIDDATGAPVAGATVGTAGEGLGGDMDFSSLPTFGHFAALSPGHGANSEGAIYFFNGSDGGGLIRQFIGNTSETLGTEDLIIAPSGNVIVGSPFNASGAGSIYLLDGIGATYATIDQLDGLSAGESLGDSGVTTIDVFSRSAFDEFLVFSPLRDGAGVDSGGIILAKTVGPVGPGPILLGVVNGAGAGDRLGDDPFSQMLSNGNTVFFNPTADDPTGPGGTADDEGAIVLMDSVGAFLGRFFGQSPGENLGSEFTVFESFRVGANSMFVQSPDASPGAVSNAGSLYLLSTADASLIGQADGDTVNENFSD
ncbi:MAG: filamentous hemagglutinin N-terminal domain-containing protein, partial [Gammaproteobacteria bacterium]